MTKCGREQEQEQEQEQEVSRGSNGGSVLPDDAHSRAQQSTVRCCAKRQSLRRPLAHGLLGKVGEMTARRCEWVAGAGVGSLGVLSVVVAGHDRQHSTAQHRQLAKPPGQFSSSNSSSRAAIAVAAAKGLVLSASLSPWSLQWPDRLCAVPAPLPLAWPLLRRRDPQVLSLASRSHGLATAAPAS